LKQSDIQYAQLKVVIIRTNNVDETPLIVFHDYGKIILKDQHLIRYSQKDLPTLQHCHEVNHFKYMF